VLPSAHVSGVGTAPVCKIIAHRGASAYEPENTIRAIVAAIRLGADMVEVDVHSTRDDQLVVIHDAEVDRTTNGKGAVRDMSFQEIKKLEAGMGEKVPALQEVLKLSRNRIVVMIEIKSTGIERLLTELLEAEDAVKQVIITSFMTDAIRKVKESNQHIQTGQIFSWKIWNMARMAAELKASYMLPQHELVSSEIVDELHGKQLSLFTWIVDSRSEAERLVGLGVDGIITNKPDLMSD
jgi:glycerophosphoryl diester phosphodiesterase